MAAYLFYAAPAYPTLIACVGPVIDEIVVRHELRVDVEREKTILVRQWLTSPAWTPADQLSKSSTTNTNSVTSNSQKEN